MGLHIPLWFIFFLHGRTAAFVFLEPHHDDVSGWRRGEIGSITSIPPFLVYFSRRPEKGLEQRPRFWFSIPQRNTRLSLGSRNISTLLISTSTLPGE